MNRIYKAIENKLGTSFGPISYQTMNNEVEREVGIFLYEAENDKEDLTGTVYEVIKAHIQVNAANGETGLYEALNYLRAFVDKIESERSGIEGLKFKRVKHIGPKAVPIGKNDYNIQVCVCNINIKYLLD